MRKIAKAVPNFGMNVRLGRGDAALVFRADGTWELLLPKQKPDEIVAEPGRLAGLCCVALDDQGARAAVEARMNALCEEEAAKQGGS